MLFAQDQLQARLAPPTTPMGKSSASDALLVTWPWEIFGMYKVKLLHSPKPTHGWCLKKNFLVCLAFLVLCRHCDLSLCWMCCSMLFWSCRWCWKWHTATWSWAKTCETTPCSICCSLRLSVTCTCSCGWRPHASMALLKDTRFRRNVGALSRRTEKPTGDPITANHPSPSMSFRARFYALRAVWMFTLPWQNCWPSLLWDRVILQIVTWLICVHNLGMIGCRDNCIILQLLVAVCMVTSHTPGLNKLPVWNGRGIVCLFLLHAGPTEYIYYWYHRLLHECTGCYKSYHVHHHAASVPEPTSGIIHSSEKKTCCQFAADYH